MQKTFEVTSFTGGITDEYIEADNRFVNHAENLCLDHAGDIVQRQGSHFLEGSDPKDGSFVSSQTAVTHTAEFKFNNQVQNYLACIHNSGQSLAIKQLSGGALTNFDFTMPTFTPHSQFNSSVWQAQPFFSNASIATGQGNYPTKVTEDKSHQLNVITAGLPEPMLNAKNMYVSPDPQVGITVGFRNVLAGAPITDPYTGTAVGATVSQLPTGVSNEFRLACVYRRSYEINGVEYEDISTPHFIGYISNAANLPVGRTPGTSYLLEVRINDTLVRETNGIQWQTNWSSVPYTYQNDGITDDPDSQPYLTGGSYDTSEAIRKNAKIKVSFYKTTSSGSIYYNFGPGNLYKSNPNSGGFVFEYTSGVLGVDYKFDMDFGVPYELMGKSGSDCSWSDAELQLQPTLYTTSGVQTNDLPGRTRYNTLVNDNYMYWVDAENPYRVRQASSRDPDSVPAGNFLDFPEIITGINSAADKLIVCTLNNTYRVDGFYDDFGRGTVSTEKISSETGTISHNSMVRVSDGLFFCGVDGFYYTNGQTVQKISRHLSATYFRLTQPIFDVSNAFSGSITTNYGKKYVVRENQDITGVYDTLNNRVMWSFLGGTEVMVCEKAWGFSEKMSFFGPWKLPCTSSTDVDLKESVYAKTLGTFINKIVRTDANGNIFQLEDGVSSDPRPYSLMSTAPLNWLAADRYPILYRLRTQSSLLGSQVQKKWVTRMSAVFKRMSAFFPTGNFFDRRLDVQVTSINDKGRVVQDLKPFHYDENDLKYSKSKMPGGRPYNSLLTTYQSQSSNPYSQLDKDNTVIKMTRRFIAKGLRCNTKALEFKPSLSLIAKADDYGLCVFNGSAASIVGGSIWSKYAYTGNVITLKQQIGSVITTDHSVEGYFIALEHDNYTTLYPITNLSGSGDTAILGTPFTNYTGVVAPSGTYKWKLYSYAKNQFFGLCAYSMSFSEALDSDSLYRLSGNAGDKGEP
jgi:hypothetical protein